MKKKNKLLRSAAAFAVGTLAASFLPVAVTLVALSLLLVMASLKD